MPSPFENNPYDSSAPQEPPVPPQQPAPYRAFHPAGNGELALALLLLACALLTANSFLNGGFHLGYGVGAFAIMTVTSVYVLKKAGRVRWYPLVCLAGGLILTASMARSHDGAVKFWLLCLSLAAYLLGLSQTVFSRHYPAGQIGSLLGAWRALFALPYPQIAPSLRGLFTRQTPEGPQRRKLGGVLLGLLLAIPALAVILPLLMRSDAAFEGLMGKTILSDASELLSTLILGGLLFLPLYARPVALTRREEPSPRAGGQGVLAPVTLNAFLCAVSFFYLLYLFSQLAYFFSAFGGILPQGYTRAEYARRGFFEMAILCGINLGIVALSMGLVRREHGISKLTKALCTFILLFSLVLVACSVSKMALYIGTYGLTRLRVLTSIFMACTAVAVVGVLLWIFLPRFPYMKVIVLTVLLAGCLTGWLDVDTQVARYNVDAYLSGRLDTVDVSHLSELSEGAIPQLARLLEAEDPEIRTQVRAALVNAIEARFSVTESQGALVLTPYEDMDFRSWTWTTARAMSLLEALAPQLQPELPL